MGVVGVLVFTVLFLLLLRSESRRRITEAELLGVER